VIILQYPLALAPQVNVVAFAVLEIKKINIVCCEGEDGSRD